MALLTSPRPTTVHNQNFIRPCRYLSKADPVLGDLIATIGLCRLRPSSRYFPTLCDSIISQQLSAKAAATIYARFAALYSGHRPTPMAVTATPLQRLRAVGLSTQKVRYVLDLAEGFSDGRIQPRKLARQTNEEIITTLSTIQGIGRWTAEMFLIFSLNRLDVLPVDDLGIQKAAQKCYGIRTLPSPTTLRTIGKPWHPYETLACWYLWHSLRL